MSEGNIRSPHIYPPISYRIKYTLEKNNAKWGDIKIATTKSIITAGAHHVPKQNVQAMPLHYKNSETEVPDYSSIFSTS